MFSPRLRRVLSHAGFVSPHSTLAPEVDPTDRGQSLSVPRQTSPSTTPATGVSRRLLGVQLHRQGIATPGW